MTKEEFHKIMDNPFEITTEGSKSINNLIEEYPYFQTARVISLRGIRKHSKEDYNSALKKAASYSSDRTLLFDYITHKKIFEESSKIKNNQSSNKSIAQSTNDNINLESIEFNKNEIHSFLEWLKFSTQNKEEDKVQQENLSVIDRFIELNPKLSPIKDRKKNINIAQNSIKENKNLMTETLANIYVEQKKYDKAIQAFGILSLKYPEKSGYFADQIRSINNLEKK